MRRLFVGSVALVVASLSISGCFGGDSSTTPPTFAGFGESCASGNDCRGGLVCDTTSLTCQAGRNRVEGQSCALTLDCSDGLYCNNRRECATSGTGDEGATCETTADCASGLVCELSGFGASCATAGTTDLGDGCTGASDCLAGLVCASAGGSTICSEPPRAPLNAPPSPPAVGVWTGADCTAVDSGPARAYFQVPRGTSDDGDFYRLPFPNDVRLGADGLDLSNHPSPGTALPIDAIDRYLRAAEEDLDGFALNPVIYFRFSEPYDWDSTAGNFTLVDVEPSSPTYGDAIPAAWLNTFGPITRYMCSDWLGIRTLHGYPLRPNNRYAVILNTSITPSPDVGGTYARDADFVAMLDTNAPADTTLQSAWDAYAPLRDYIANDPMVNASDILVATVFTTQSEPEMASFRTAIRAESVPTVSDLTLCGMGVTSPCEDAEGRGACGTPDPAFHEIHGRIALPRFQQGTAPYVEPSDGGDIARDMNGAPIVQDTMDVCFAMTIPAGVTMPMEGWPVVVAGHGTGGSYMTAIDNGIASDVVGATSGMSTVNAATIAIDFPAHGSRRGASNESPDRLFFNVANPRAARDNVIQGAADLMSLLYYLENASIDTMTSPTGEAISFDATRITMFMHSQGATHASHMIADEPLASHVVLSGIGGDLTQSLLYKTAPTDISSIVPVALMDFSLDGVGNVNPLPTGDFHPALALFQMFFEAADPVNIAGRIHRGADMSQAPTNVFMTYGMGDTYTPQQVMDAYALAAGMVLVRPVLQSLSLFEADAPLSENISVNGTPTTIGMRQYDPPMSVDGHFVAYQESAARPDVRRFLLQSLAGQATEIGQ